MVSLWVYEINNDNIGFWFVYLYDKVVITVQTIIRL